MESMSICGSVFMNKFRKVFKKRVPERGTSA